jgi:hypothetical protein
VFSKNIAMTVKIFINQIYCSFVLHCRAIESVKLLESCCIRSNLTDLYDVNENILLSATPTPGVMLPTSATQQQQLQRMLHPTVPPQLNNASLTLVYNNHINALIGQVGGV